MNELFEPTFLNLEYLFARVLDFFRGTFNVQATEFFALKLLLFLLAVFFLIAIFYTTIQMHELRKKEKDRVEHEYHRALDHAKPATHAPKEAKTAAGPADLPYEPHEEPETPMQQRFKQIKEEYLQSSNPSDWKIAIIDADNMLDDVLASLGFPGTTLGERLRNAARSFKSAEGAGKAHGIRNKIAHDPMYELTHDDAREAIALYEKTFKEFNYI